MGSGKRLTMEEIGKIKVLKEEGFSNRAIAKKINRSPGVVDNFVRDPENYGKHQKGRTNKATTATERRKILRTASNSKLTARQIRENTQTSASVRTVQRIIKSSPNLQRRRLKKKPALTEEHKEQRLHFAREHMQWSDEWNRVIFTDEKRFTLDGPDGYAFCFHDLRKEELFLSRHHRRQGGIMVWGPTSFNGPIELVFISGRQTSEDYKNILIGTKNKINQKIGSDEWIFQQDNAPIHTSRVVKQWFEEEQITVLNWPASSPDLNIIENVWGWMTRKIYESGRQFSNIDDLQQAIISCWNNIPLEFIRSLYYSLSNRIFEIINKNGGNTNY